jgi:hypothetical protein
MFIVVDLLNNPQSLFEIFDGFLGIAQFFPGYAKIIEICCYLRMLIAINWYI